MKTAMKTVTFNSPETGLISYTDKKRWLWLLSLVYPIFPIAGVVAHYLTGSEMALFLPLVLIYAVIPMLDAVLGEDLNNPPEEVVPELSADNYYRYLLHLTGPLHFVTFFVCVYWVGTQNLSWVGFLAITLATGIASGLGLNTSHELGHKVNKVDRFFAKFVLSVSGYGHFCIEHNAGHHRYVATPEDSASSKMGENIYAFALREIPGGFVRGWNLEKSRLQRKGLPVWSYHNDLLQSYAVTVIMQVSALLLFGWIMVPFLIIHNVLAWWQLTSANYIEHYGLLRTKKDNGKYENCKPHHSWNSNHIFSNLVLYHLERHSDHHAHPTREYQSLRHFDNVPELPNGYFGSFLLAYIPWLWFKIMNPKLLALKHIDGDMNKVNVLPEKREALMKKYGLNNSQLEKMAT